jgi:predicted phage-related endonuclease
MERKGFLGGSDANRIMAGDWHKLWLEKTGRSEPDDLSGNIAVQLGSHTESFNLDWFVEQHPNTNISAWQYPMEMNWEGIPLKGTADAMIQPEPDSISHEMIECKHTHERNNMEAVLQRYMPQLQFYMWLGIKDGIYVSVIFGNNRWECVYVKKDWDYINKMQVHLAEFWKCVTTDTEPASAPAPTSIDKIPVDGMVRRDASGDNEFISMCHDYIKFADEAKTFDNVKSNLKDMVGDNEREVYCELLTIKRDKRGALRFTVKEN